METASRLYKDMAARTGGDIYLGVVGPVRTGKSTFIKRFMDVLVLPNMEEGYGVSVPPMSCPSQRQAAPS